MKKRGMSQMWWILGSMVLVLVVIGVLIYIFSDKIAGFQERTESCFLKGGTCKGSCAAGEEEILNVEDCKGDKPVCCAGLGT